MDFKEVVKNRYSCKKFSARQVEELLNMVCASNPGIALEYYLSPHTGLKPEKISPPLY
ncbi:MAG: hypothetical protein IJ858_08850 [Acidaminococcaceae bacterium]|nr:hypothetical protein [Acidaminococcaceae bacterium]